MMRCWEAHQMVDFASDSDPPTLLHNRAFGAWPLTRQAKGSRVLVLSSTMDHIKGLGGGKAAAVCARLLCLILLCGLVRWWWGHEFRLHHHFHQAGLQPHQPRELRHTNPAPVR